jgi:hypothetical protein
MKTLKLIFLFLVTATLTVSCSNDDDTTTTTNTGRQFGIFKVLNDDTTIEMDGVIGSTSLTNFNSLTAAYPNINKINIKNCDGSSDDETNLLLSAKVHQKGINIHILDNGEIASGGVDFFIAGIQRTQGSNTKI